MCGLWDDLNDRYAPPEVVRELARAMLASMDAEPAGYHVIKECGKVGCSVATLEEAEKTRDFWNKKWTIRPYFYSAAPAPVVPDAISTRQAISKMEECEPCDSINVAYKYGWNACRDAMLNGDTFRENPISSTNNFREIAETSTNSPVIPEEIPNGLAGQIVSLLAHNIGDKFLAQKIWNACRAAMLQGSQPVSNHDELSSPVIPDGYALVPIVPTEDMVINGFESEPDPHFSDEKVWAEYKALSGCRRAARRAELCWAAMIKAAPKPEGNNG